MALLGENLDYSDKDFDSLRLRVFSLLSSVFPDWTARQRSNFGNVLVELYCFVGDVLLKYQDNQANESRWSKATQRKNLLALAKLIDYEAATATASQVDMTINIVRTVSPGQDVVFPAGTVVKTLNIATPVEFRLINDETIPAGDTQITGATAENSEDQEDSFTSPGTPNLELKLTATPYLDGSTVISAGNGAFTEVDNFLDTASTDFHYTISVDQNDQATVRFGDSVNGVIPAGTITVFYKTGGGASGIVEAGTVLSIDGTFTDDFGNPVTVTVTNPNESTVAVDRETREQIRQNAPLSIRTLNRTVSREDFEINAKKLSAVGRALMLTSDQFAAIAENTGILYVIPVGGGVPSTALKAEVLTQVTETFPSTLTFTTQVNDPLYVSINIETRVRFGGTDSREVVAARILSNLQTYFAVENSDGTANTNVDFGFYYKDEDADTIGAFPFSDVYNVIRDTAGVSKMDAEDGLTLNGFQSDVSIALNEFPQLGTVTIIDVETGTAV